MAEVVISPPRTAGFICLTNLPYAALRNVREQVSYVSEKTPGEGLKNVLVVAPARLRPGEPAERQLRLQRQHPGRVFEKEPSEKRSGHR